MSAPVVVKVQAIWPLCPMTRNGTPGPVAPASTLVRRFDADQVPQAGKAEAQMRVAGQQRRAGIASTVPSTAQALEAEEGRVNGAGKAGRMPAAPLPWRRRERLRPIALAEPARGPVTEPCSRSGRSGWTGRLPLVMAGPIRPSSAACTGIVPGQARP